MSEDYQPQHLDTGTHTRGYQLREVRKAVVSAGATFLAALGTSALDGSVTGGETVAALGFAGIAAAAVFGIKNLPPKVR